APCSAGSNAGCSTASGRGWWRPATSWAGSTGRGRPRTACWARPGWGGPDRAQPHGPGEERYQEEPAGRAPGGPLGGGAWGGERPGREALGGDPRGDRRGAAGADRRAAAALVSGQGL